MCLFLRRERVHSTLQFCTSTVGPFGRLARPARSAPVNPLAWIVRCLMKSIAFVRAFYIKLGRAGTWEADSIETGKLRFGWRGQSVEDINAGRWTRIEQQLK